MGSAEPLGRRYLITELRAMLATPLIPGTAFGSSW
jgi:hypothetical protein